MMRSLYAGISGLRNHQTRMDVIGNNIANVNTIGFKGSRVNFQDMLSQTLQGASGGTATRGGTNPIQIGMGMGVASIDTVFTDGSFQTTGKQTDLAISGQGFFILGDGDNQVYTRAGGFDFDTAGNLLVPGTGYKVMGYKADSTGAIDPNQSLQSIQIPVGSSMPARKTTEVKYSNNLMSSAKAIGTSAAIAAANAALALAQNAVTAAATATANAAALNPTSADTVAAAAIVSATPADTAAAAALATATAADTAAGTALTAATTADTAANAAKLAAAQAKLDADAAKIAADLAVSTGLPADYAAAASAAAVAVTSSAAALLAATPATLASATQANTDAIAVKTAADAAALSGLPADALLTQAASSIAQASAITAQTTATAAQTATATALATATAAKAATAATLATATAAKATTAAAITAALATATTPATAQAVANATIGAATAATNLSAATAAVAAANDKSSDAQSSITVYDPQGNSYQLTGTFEKTADNTWSFTPASTIQNAAGTVIANVTSSAPIVIEFNKDGSFKQSTASVKLTIDQSGITPASPYAGAGKFDVTPDFSALTQYGGATTVSATGQDGYASGSLEKTSINTSGIIVGQFSNGQILNLAQLALANFNNPSGLGKSGESLYVKTTNSGEPQIGIGGSGGR